MANWEITVDQEKKLVKCVMSDKFESADSMRKVCEDFMAELKKFGKGEPLGCADTSNLDMAFLTPEMSKIMDETGIFVMSYCKKYAAIIQSKMFQKSWESGMENVSFEGTNLRMFDNEKDAMKWLED